MSRVITYCETETTTSVWVFDRRSPVVLFAHSDGVTWLASSNTYPRLPQEKDLGCEAVRARMNAMPPVVAALYDWATKLGLAFGQSRSQPKPESEPLDSETVGTTTVVFESLRRKVGEYTPARIKEIVAKAVRLCRDTWGWAPEAIRVQLHSGDAAMGRAYRPGTLDSTRTRRVSLSRVLFSKYDANAIHRVIIHELCHHYRDERWPRSVLAANIDGGHDAKFCEALARVDPLVAQNPKSCVFFVEQVDETVVAAASKGVVWSPGVGTLVMKRLKSGWVRYAWEPVQARAWKAVGDKLHDESFVTLLKRFAPGQWKDVRVAWYNPGAGIFSLADLLRFYMNDPIARTRLPKTTAYLASLAPGATIGSV